SSVPRLGVNGLRELGGAGAAGFRFLMMLAQYEQFGEIAEDTDLKPGEPDALAFTAQSDAVEAVVPIASPDQRQSMRTSRGSASDGASAMFAQRTCHGGDDRHGTARRLWLLQAFRFEKRRRLMEDRGTGGGAH